MSRTQFEWVHPAPTSQTTAADQDDQKVHYMDSELQALDLPAFELDCRDWFISTPEDGSAPDDLGGAPVIAVLSTAVIDDAALVPASAVLTVGLMDEPYQVCAGEPAAELLEMDIADGSASYLVPSPRGQLALLAEFSSGAAGAVNKELLKRFHVLMSSFQWTAA